jgi:predicted HicB family RNase H-like nuclease
VVIDTKTPLCYNATQKGGNEMENAKTRLNAYVGAETHKEAKIQAVKEGISLSELVERALQEYLTKQSRGANDDRD